MGSDAYPEDGALALAHCRARDSYHQTVDRRNGHRGGPRL